MFVDRERELKALEEMYKLFLRGHSRGVIVYGFRKVGKTTLVKVFVENRQGIWIDLSWVNSVESFVRIISRILNKEVSVSFEDPVEAIIDALWSLEEYARENDLRIPVALDEFHILIERLPIKLAKKYGVRRDEVFVDLLWKLRGLITSSSHIFWVLISSIGWAKISEYLREKRSAKGALLGILEKLEVKPLQQEHSVLLSRLLIGGECTEICENIARLSGGIPRIIEILARRYNTTKEKPLKLAISAILEGEFDELFDSMIRFLAEFARRDFDTLIQALKAISEGNKTPGDVARYLSTTRDSAYNILEELVRLGLLDKKKIRNRTMYELEYPLLKEWLLLRVQPQRDKTELLARALGITAEAYLRELLGEAIGKKIIIHEDREGSIFYGTTSKLELNIKRVFTKKETEQLLRGIKNADIIAKNDIVYLIEVKITTQQIREKEIKSLINTLNVVANRTKKQVKGVLAILEDEPTHLAVAEAIKHNIIIMSPKAIRILAKKLDYPHW